MPNGTLRKQPKPPTANDCWEPSSSAIVQHKKGKISPSNSASFATNEHLKDH